MKPDGDRRKRGPGAVLPLALAVICAPAGWLIAQNAPTADPPPVLPGQPILLQYKEVDTTIESRSVRFSSQTQAFAKEPDFAGRKPTRGFFLFGTNRVDRLPFIWDQSRGKLYLDLNRNQDLTDDPQGVFTRHSSGRYSYYQEFRGIRVTFETPQGIHRTCFDLTLYSSRGQPTCTINARSFWEGRATLQGRDLQVGIIENLTTPGSTQGACLLIRAWSERTRSFTLDDRAVEAVTLCPNLFYEKEAYQVRCKYAAHESAPAFMLQFDTRSAELGELNLPGQNIKRLVLTGAQAATAWTVVLDEPEPMVRIPVGTYKHCQVRLAKDTMEASLDPSRYGGYEPPVAVVTSAKPVTVQIGGPVTNTVSVQRAGRNLHFAYDLVGAGGRTYRLIQLTGEKRPRFSVVKDGKQIASGNFEFG